MFDTVIHSQLPNQDLMLIPADSFPMVNPIHWLTSHFAVGGHSPLQRLSGMLTAHMTQIKPHNGFPWHQHRGLEIYTYVIDGELYHEDSTGGKGTITAGEVQRMFSGNYIQHQELNRSDEYARVIQIWFVAETKYMGLAPEYEQISLDQMPPRKLGDGVVRDIIGENGATNSHVNARLTSTIVPAGGQTTFEPPRPNEDMFLYVVNGSGTANGTIEPTGIGLYDVILATPDAISPTLTAGDKPLNFLSFYLPSFISGK